MLETVNKWCYSTSFAAVPSSLTVVQQESLDKKYFQTIIKSFPNAFEGWSDVITANKGQSNKDKVQKVQTVVAEGADVAEVLIKPVLTYEIFRDIYKVS